MGGPSANGETHAHVFRSTNHEMARSALEPQRASAHGAPELVLHASAVKAGGKVVVELVGEADPANGEALIAYGWAMAEALADGLATPRS